MEGIYPGSGMSKPDMTNTSRPQTRHRRSIIPEGRLIVGRSPASADRHSSIKQTINHIIAMMMLPTLTTQTT